MLDFDKTVRWLIANIRTMDYHVQQGQKLTFRQTHELNGGKTALRTLLTAIENGELNADPTPVKEIKFRTENIVRRNDPETSFKAAISQTSKKRQDIYYLIWYNLRFQKSRGMTDDELVRDVNWDRQRFSPSGIRTRRAELVKAGWVRDSGQTRDSFAGHPATVWELVPQKNN